MRSATMRAIMIAVVSAAVCGAVAVGGAWGVAAEREEKRPLTKNAAGVDKVEINCAACHSLDYIPMNSPFLSAAEWDAEVTKMINAFGAPISPGDAKIIGDYLKANY